MKCKKVKCPHCKQSTIIPALNTKDYSDNYYTEADGFFHCIKCGKRFSVTALLKLGKCYTYKLTES